MADETKPARKCSAVCIKCWDTNAVVRMDIDGCEPVFTCTGCDEEFGPDDVQAVIDAAGPWTKLLNWIDEYPEA